MLVLFCVQYLHGEGGSTQDSSQLNLYVAFHPHRCEITLTFHYREVGDSMLLDCKQSHWENVAVVQ